MNFLQVRYRFDEPTLYGLELKDLPNGPGSTEARARLLSEAVQITPALFPELANHLRDLSTTMFLPEEIDCFVTAQPEMQAFCITHSRRGCERYSVVLSSGLIERLEPEEIRFVIGHEVGHFLCEHWRYPRPDRESGLGQNLAALRLSRAAEISADRIGMVACGSLNSACAAMIKIAAGCGSPHLRPDVPSLLHQFRQLSLQEKGITDGIWMTHPIIPLRIRAILRFESVYRKITQGSDSWHDELQDVDKSIESDFDSSTGQALQHMSNQQLESVRCWGLVYLFCADGVISKTEQRLMEETLGPERSGKVLKFLRNQSGSPVDAVTRKLSDAAAEARHSPFDKRKNLVTEFNELVEQAGIVDAPIESALCELRRMLLDEQ